MCFSSYDTDNGALSENVAYCMVSVYTVMDNTHQHTHTEFRGAVGIPAGIGKEAESRCSEEEEDRCNAGG